MVTRPSAPNHSHTLAVTALKTEIRAPPQIPALSFHFTYKYLYVNDLLIYCDVANRWEGRVALGAVTFFVLFYVICIQTNIHSRLNLEVR